MPARIQKLELWAFVFAVMSASALVAPSGAQAQAWLQDRERTEGIGIRVGDLEIHPGVGAEIGYDSNVFYSDQNEQSSAILRLSPHLHLSTLGAERRGQGEEREGSPPTVQFRGGLSAAYYIYFLDEARDNLEGNLDLSLTILPRRPFSISLIENFNRGIRPFTEAGAIGGNYRRIRNEAGIRFQYSSPGQVLTANAGYTADVNVYEGDSFSFANSLTHNVMAGVGFLFFPETALIYDAKLSFTDYFSDDSPSVFLSNSARFRTRIGINGALTNKVSFSVLGGYAAGFYDGNVLDDYDSVIAQVELRWNISDTTRFLIGYDRDFENSVVGGSYRRDRGYTSFQLMVSSVFLLGIEGSVGLYDFGRVLDASGMAIGSGERSDVRASAQLFGEYRVTNWLGFNATLGYTGDFTDFSYNRVLGMATVPDPAKYNKFEAWLGVRAFY